MIKNIDPAILRKYITEIVILALAASVVYLFNQVSGLNKYIIQDLGNDRREMIKVIEHNTQVIQSTKNINYDLFKKNNDRDIIGNDSRYYNP